MLQRMIIRVMSGLLIGNKFPCISFLTQALSRPVIRTIEKHVIVLVTKIMLTYKT